jgi:hypothetical protein
VTTFLFFRQTIADARAVWVLISRTRLLVRLVLISLAAIAAGALTSAAFLPTLALVVALAATLTSAATLAGPHAGRATAMTLRHPASPLALATSRWVAIATLAGIVTLATGVGVAWQVELSWRAGVAAAWSAAGVSVPMAACGVLLSAESWRRRAP